MDISKEILIAREGGIDEPQGPDDNVDLPQPQIINMSPTSTDTISNSSPTIKASLIATEGATIEESSIIFEIDNRDVTQEIKINKISDSEHTIIYISETPLAAGLHKIFVSFNDSSGGEVEKEWTFTITGEEEEDGENFNILGFKIPKRTLFIVLGGIGLILFAILIPLLIPIIWKDKSKEINSSSILPQSLPPTDDLPPTNTQAPTKSITEENFTPPEPVIPTPLQEASLVFEAPQPDIPTPPTPVIKEEFKPPEPEISTLQSNDDPTPTFKAPEPEEELANLYEQLKDLKDKDDSTT